MRQAGFCGDAAPRSAARLAALLARVVGGLLRVVTGPGSACGLSAGLWRVCRGRLNPSCIRVFPGFVLRKAWATGAGLARRKNLPRSQRP